MAKHDVKFTVPSRPLAYKDIEFEIKTNNKKFGELRVSQGGILWVPRDHTYGYKLNWAQVAGLAEQRGKKENR